MLKKRIATTDNGRQRPVLDGRNSPMHNTKPWKQKKTMFIHNNIMYEHCFFLKKYIMYIIMF